MAADQDQCIALYNQFHRTLTEANHPTNADAESIDRTVNTILFRMLSDFVEKQKAPMNRVNAMQSSSLAERNVRNRWLYITKEILDDYEVRERNFYLDKFQKFHDKVKGMGEDSLAYILQQNTAKLKPRPLQYYNRLEEDAAQDMIELCRGTQSAFRAITAVFKVKYFNRDFSAIWTHLNDQIAILYKIVKHYKKDEALSQLDAIRLGGQVKLALFMINMRYFVYEFEMRRALSFRSMYDKARQEIFFIDEFVEDHPNSWPRVLTEEWDFFSVHMTRFEEVKFKLQANTDWGQIFPSIYDNAAYYAQRSNPADPTRKPTKSQAEFDAVTGRV